MSTGLLLEAGISLPWIMRRASAVNWHLTAMDNDILLSWHLTAVDSETSPRQPRDFEFELATPCRCAIQLGQLDE